MNLADAIAHAARMGAIGFATVSNHYLLKERNSVILIEHGKMDKTLNIHFRNSYLTTVYCPRLADLFTDHWFPMHMAWLPDGYDCKDGLITTVKGQRFVMCRAEDNPLLYPLSTASKEADSK